VAAVAEFSAMQERSGDPFLMEIECTFTPTCSLPLPLLMLQQQHFSCSYPLQCHYERREEYLHAYIRVTWSDRSPNAHIQHQIYALSKRNAYAPTPSDTSFTALLSIARRRSCRCGLTLCALFTIYCVDGTRAHCASLVSHTVFVYDTCIACCYPSDCVCVSNICVLCVCEFSLFSLAVCQMLFVGFPLLAFGNFIYIISTFVLAKFSPSTPYLNVNVSYSSVYLTITFYSL